MARCTDCRSDGRKSMIAPKPLVYALLLLAGTACSTMTPDEKIVNELAAIGLESVITERGVVVYLPDVLFDFNSARLSERALQQVAAIGDVALRLAEGRPLAIEGHTDSIGDDEYNLDLSRRRAETVLEALAETGVPRELMRSEGFGEQFPIAPNKLPDGRDDPEGRQRNRRVEVVIEY